MSLDENIERVERKGWIVDRDVSYHDSSTDHIWGNDKTGDYSIGIGLDSTSGQVGNTTIIKDQNGEDREARRWELQSIPTPQQVADAFERPQSIELRVTELEACCHVLISTIQALCETLEVQNGQIRLLQHARWHNDWQMPDGATRFGGANTD